MALLVDYVTAWVDKISKTVNQAPFKVILIIMAWILGYIVIKPSFNPSILPFSELK